MGLLGNILKVAAPVGGFLLGGPAGAMAGSAISSGISGAENQSKANTLTQQAERIGMQRYNETAPLRSRALQMALAPRAQREDLSALFADPGNPYSRVVPRPTPSADLSRVAMPNPGPAMQAASEQAYAARVAALPDRAQRALTGSTAPKDPRLPSRFR